MPVSMYLLTYLSVWTLRRIQGLLHFFASFVPRAAKLFMPEAIGKQRSASQSDSPGSDESQRLNFDGPTTSFTYILFSCLPESLARANRVPMGTPHPAWNARHAANWEFAARFIAVKSVSRQDKTHKIIHDLAKTGGVNLSAYQADGTYNPFNKYDFTGTVRPVYPLSPPRVVPDHIPRPDYAEDGKPKSEMERAGQPPRILSPEEQEKMRIVCRLAREVLDIAASHVRPGVTTDEIDEVVHNATIERNAYPSPLNYRNFPKSVCTSVNEVICHGIPDQRKLKEGDIVNIDVTLYYDGYHGDLNDTYPVGEIDEESKKLIRTTREALDAAIKICKPGALFRDLGKVIEPIARANGCAVVRTYTGHGINDLFHCSPNVPHYAKNKAIGTMKAGMAFSIEPMLNLGTNWGDVHWPDNWTATTTDGRRSAQFEDTVLITDNGVEILTKGNHTVL